MMLLTFAPLVLIFSLALSYVLVLRPIYNVFFHPLRKFPGPKLWAATQIPYQLLYMSGEGHKRMLDMHKKYGDVVRVTPNQLAIHRPDAWKEIMGHRKGSATENGKDPVFYGPLTHTILAADTADHGRYRRMMSHGFSAQSMLEQQPLIVQYVGLLMERLHEKSAGGTKILDIVKWFNFTTFDIIGDLAFGEPFGCLQVSEYHPWVALIFHSIYQGALLGQLRRHFKTIDTAIQSWLNSAMKKRAEHRALTAAKVRKRMAEDPRPDFMQSLLTPKTQDKLTVPELEETANVLIVAGSETTATALSGAVYYLCRNPNVLAKLADEVLGSFGNEDEIDLLSTQRLRYMHAVLEESLRMFPPVPSALPRITPSSGQVLFGEFVPAGTSLNVWQWPLYRDHNYFALADEFHPERWLGDDERFKNDRKEAFQPFSFGPRNCIGKNLAYAEMRLILARLVWNFEIHMDEASRDWINQNRVYTLWQKQELLVRLVPRTREKA